MVVPRILGRTAYPVGAAFVDALSEPPEPAPITTAGLSACSSRWTRPCFSSTPRHVSHFMQVPRGTLVKSDYFGPVPALRFSPRNPNFGQTSPRPAASTAERIGYLWEALWERPAGPKHTRAEQVKARTTPLRPSRTSTGS